MAISCGQDDALISKIYREHPYQVGDQKENNYRVRSKDRGVDGNRNIFLRMDDLAKELKGEASVGKEQEK